MDCMEYAWKLQKLSPLPASHPPWCRLLIYAALAATATLHQAQRYQAVLRRFSIALVTLLVYEAQRGSEPSCHPQQPSLKVNGTCTLAWTSSYACLTRARRLSRSKTPNL